MQVQPRFVGPWHAFNQDTYNCRLEWWPSGVSTGVLHRGGSRLFVKGGGGGEFVFMSILHFLAKKNTIVRANLQ